MPLLSSIKSLIPPPLLAKYHRTLATVAEVAYGHPSDKMIVIGVTGTNGKSSTVNFLAQILTTLGHTVGFTSTAGFNIAGKEVTNAMKMTMPGRFNLQRLLRRMVDAGCTVAIVETSSQGLIQHRHIGINYDVALFTNLTPEHIEAHGGFENYKNAKAILFEHLTARPHKVINGKKIAKVNVVNSDDEYGAFYGAFPADRHVKFGFTGTPTSDQLVAFVEYSDIGASTLSVNGIEAPLKLRADFEHKNALAAVAGAVAVGIPLVDAMAAASCLHSVPGRFETIDCGQSFTVIVDYAYEPFALLALYKSLPSMRNGGNIIGVHGSAGGGRDVARRFEIGKIAAEHEDIVVVTNEDPYDEDPRVIIDAVADGARKMGKTDDENLFIIDDRAEAIQKAISLAEPGDVVLITGKGSEPVMAVANGKKIPWDDRVEARRALEMVGYTL